MSPDMERTLELLKLTKKYHCVIVRDDPKIMGMLKKVKDYATWGVISPDMIKSLIEKRGRLPGDKRVPADRVKEFASAIESGKDSELKSVFRLHPPRKGWKDTKATYPAGDLGPRKSIDDVIKKMM